MTFHDRYPNGNEQTIVQQVTAGNAYRAYFQEDGTDNQDVWFDILGPTGARATSNVIRFQLIAPPPPTPTLV